MAGRRERAAVVHRRADGDAGRHLVVEQPADLLPQQRGEFAISRIVRAAGVRVDAAGEVAFEVVEHRGGFVEIVRTRPGATRCRRLRSAALPGARGIAGRWPRSSVLAWLCPLPPPAVPPTSTSAPALTQLVDALRPATSPRRWRAACRPARLRTSRPATAMNLLGLRPGEQDHQAGVRAELAGSHQAAGGEFAGDVVQPLVERAGQNRRPG